MVLFQTQQENISKEIRAENQRNVCVSNMNLEKNKPEQFQILDMLAVHSVLQCSAGFQTLSFMKIFNSAHQQVQFLHYNDYFINVRLKEIQAKKRDANLQLTENSIFCSFLM